ncbi:MAG TPA: endonuclease/exonuclease/phosphatase family protein [Micromonosporaceae bacterium]|jgi:vancomycin resistance protein VanJ|nr:endonuclease/exonuclease/phosphatase family protein [Micromonosporaceae bacterium]
MATATAVRSETRSKWTAYRGRTGWIVAALSAFTAFIIGGHRLIPDVNGVGSMVDTVAPWFGIAIPVLAVVAAVSRSRTAALAVIVPLIVWLVAVGSAWLPSGGGAVQFRVANQNVDADNPDPARTVSEVEATGADIIGLEEVTPASEPAIESTLDRRYPYHVAESTVELWSRYPISDFSGVDLGLSWTRALRANVATPHGDVRVYVVHLASARAGDTATRDSTMSALVDRVRADHSARVLVIGDLNTATTDRVLAPLTAMLHDTQAAAGRGPGFTWPSVFPLTRPDHVLFRGLTAAQSAVVGTTGSDHRAITAGLRF